MSKLKSLFCAYRDWAKNIYIDIEQRRICDCELIDNIDDFNTQYIAEYKPDIIFLVGWSWMVPDNIVDGYMCLCLHPSPLPKYRGGSPIQNQVLNGEKESAVSIFRVTHGIDDGELCAQEPFLLYGGIKDIFARIRYIGTTEILNIIKQYPDIKFWPQVGEPTVCKRRIPEQSEITAHELYTSPAKNLHNKIRALQTPYPNAFIKCADGERLYITESHLEQNENDGHKDILP